MMRALLLPVFCILVSPCLAEIDFERDVEPILTTHCIKCHGAEEREGGLRFLSRQDALNLNDSGVAATIPGKSGESELIRRVVTDDELEQMPPEGERLTKKEVAVLKQWIDEGVSWPEGDPAPVHWAYKKPQRPEIPSVKWPNGATTPIDAFVLNRLKETGLELEVSPPAEPAKLLRRVYLDLIGLPPSPAEVDAFVADPSPEHYAKIVDDLLSSPRYGEKWARQWLDLARYADSNGFQADQFREIWAYRDWVINALNDDMPFDQFTIEQLAGDLLPESTVEQKIATGFHRCTTCNVEAGVDPEENRTNQVIDRVNTLGLVWLGTSLECAQCHNHKYDPFTQQDYYQIFAFFNNTPLEVRQNSGVQFEVSGPLMPLPLPSEKQQQLDKLNSQKAELDQKVAARKKELSQSQAEWVATLRSSLDSQPQWHVVEPTTFISEGGADHKILDDKSVLLTGKAPANDKYIVEFASQLKGITGIKLETLTDDSIPGKGPGRGDAERPNFVLYEFQLEQATGADENFLPVSLHTASADFSQNNWDVKGLIDSDPKTGWAINPEFHKPHWASFLLSEPINHEGGTRFRLTLPQHFGRARTIGRLRLQLMTGDPGAGAVPEDVREILAKAEDKLNGKEQKRLAAYQESLDADLIALNQQVKKLESDIKKIEPPTTLVMVEMEESRMSNIFKRGNFLDKGPEVQPAAPAALHEYNMSSNPSRLDFANWLMSTENPLVARVTVNRWWAEFFGRGIVATPEDFGTQGEKPTHPQLLDWLAVEFMENGWSMKKIHRQIVLSSTYQQDSDVTAKALELDPYNKFLARGARFRMPAEMVRDNALAMSGVISFKMGGPPVYPPQPANIWRHVGRNAPKYATDEDEDRFRRGVYVVWRRSAPYPSFVNFDAPDRGACVIQRSRTNTPLQALTMLNDPVYVELASALAKRVLTDLPDANVRERLDYIFRLAVARTANSVEVTFLQNFYQQELAKLQADAASAAKLVSKRFELKDVPKPEQAAWFEVANIVLNLDETITKN